MARHCCLL